MPALGLIKHSRVLIAAALAATLFMVASPIGAPKPAFALTNCTVSDNTFDAQEQEFLRLINQYRAQNGKSALTASTNLNRAASFHARDMAVRRYFSHTEPSGRTSSTRIQNCGGLPSTGENIAAGTVKDTAQEAFDMWRASSGHNANMLNSSYRQIGIARYYDAAAPYRWYWVTDFSTTNDGTNAGGSSSGSSGGGTVSPTPTPIPPGATVGTKAVMSSPANNARLTTSQRFTWTAGQNARGYMFYMGTSRGSNNMLSVNAGTARSLTVNGIPRGGATVYVRLWTQTPSGWQYNDYTYRLPQ